MQTPDWLSHEECYPCAFSFLLCSKMTKTHASASSSRQQWSGALLKLRWPSVQHLVTESRVEKKPSQSAVCRPKKPGGQCDTRHSWVWSKITAGADRTAATTWTPRTQAAIHVSGWEGRIVESNRCGEGVCATGLHSWEECDVRWWWRKHASVGPFRMKIDRQSNVKTLQQNPLHIQTETQP